MNRYGKVLVLAAVAALALGLLARAPRPRAQAARGGDDVAAVDTLRIGFADGAARPATASLPLGRRVALTLVNEGARPIVVGLAGYEDRLPEASLPPGDARTATLVFDRPGEAFALLVDGEPWGRIAVTGSHLPEGHR